MSANDFEDRRQEAQRKGLLESLGSNLGLLLSGIGGKIPGVGGVGGEASQSSLLEGHMLSEEMRNANRDRVMQDFLVAEEMRMQQEEIARQEKDATLDRKLRAFSIMAPKMNSETAQKTYKMFAGEFGLPWDEAEMATVGDYPQLGAYATELVKTGDVRDKEGALKLLAELERKGVNLDASSMGTMFRDYVMGLPGRADSPSMYKDVRGVLEKFGKSKEEADALLGLHGYTEGMEIPTEQKRSIIATMTGDGPLPADDLYEFVESQTTLPRAELDKLPGFAGVMEQAAGLKTKTDQLEYLQAALPNLKAAVGALGGEGDGTGMSEKDREIIVTNIRNADPSLTTAQVSAYAGSVIHGHRSLSDVIKHITGERPLAAATIHQAGQVLTGMGVQEHELEPFLDMIRLDGNPDRAMRMAEKLLEHEYRGPEEIRKAVSAAGWRVAPDSIYDGLDSFERAALSGQLARHGLVRQGYLDQLAKMPREDQSIAMDEVTGNKIPLIIDPEEGAPTAYGIYKVLSAAGATPREIRGMKDGPSIMQGARQYLLVDKPFEIRKGLIETEKRMAELEYMPVETPEQIETRDAAAAALGNEYLALSGLLAEILREEFGIDQEILGIKDEDLMDRTVKLLQMKADLERNMEEYTDRGYETPR
ncbi:MAG: hypothetical protein GY838_13685 [bacterium]|nr:hypothetical protein [bacterium]